ncbi:hypothetical protein Lalb_Chr15g0078601 [Lupinus albus]|uniref:Uncharacterized protein n=1 Tax=Lupinus albus TaxID=3870 RepID=A0A6A4P957_LUPAL|nr:hypothetical protein Lalb_Chr15g0078601 [Lupinus albus]
MFMSNTFSHCNENRAVPAGSTGKPANRTPNRYDTAVVPDTQENRLKTGRFVYFFFNFIPKK